MYPPYNKPTIDRTPLGKGAYPPSADSGEVPESKEDKLTKAAISQELGKNQKSPGRTPFVSLRASSQRFSSEHENPKI